MNVLAKPDNCQAKTLGKGSIVVHNLSDRPGFLLFSIPV